MKENDKKMETEKVFSWTIVVCLLAGIFLGTSLDGGFISEPAIWFYFPVAGYFLIRFIFWKITKRIPKLTKVQKYAVSLFPLYGFLIFFIFSSIIRGLK